ncbi:hypothetical protein DIPPA_07261 [Diplonema papillatum]|nr:hypothetical protein DIPPA_07261 [Diplonema papillatum]
MECPRRLLVLLLAVALLVGGAAARPSAAELRGLFALLPGGGAKARARTFAPLDFPGTAACEAPLAKCMTALAFAPPTRRPDPASLADDLAKCTVQLCNCAGGSAAYDADRRACLVDGEAIDAKTVTLGGNGSGGSRTVYTHAACDQIEGCFNTPCDALVWKAYTADLAACEPLWFCMRREAESALASCRSADTTSDAGGRTCPQAGICSDLEAIGSVLPEGSPDCEWEYKRVMADPAVMRQVEEACASVVCSCLRRGAVETCDSKVACCISGSAWDTATVSTRGEVAYTLLDCEEVRSCLPAAMYCGHVEEPTKHLPAACQDYAKGLYMGGTACTTSAASVGSSTGACEGAPLDACDAVRQAAEARCEEKPSMYQVCPLGTSDDAAGRCACEPSGGNATQCVGGRCVRPAPVCTAAGNCSGHAARAVPSSSACACDCFEDWTGPTCATRAPGGEDATTMLLVGVLAGCAVAVAGLSGAVCIVLRRRPPSRGSDALDGLEKSLVLDDAAAAGENRSVAHDSASLADPPAPFDRPSNAHPPHASFDSPCVATAAFPNHPYPQHPALPAALQTQPAGPTGPTPTPTLRASQSFPPALTRHPRGAAPNFFAPRPAADGGSPSLASSSWKGWPVPPTPVEHCLASCDAVTPRERADEKAQQQQPRPRPSVPQAASEEGKPGSAGPFLKQNSKRARGRSATMGSLAAMQAVLASPAAKEQLQKAGMLQGERYRRDKPAEAGGARGRSRSRSRSKGRRAPASGSLGPPLLSPPGRSRSRDRTRSRARAGSSGGRSSAAFGARASVVSSSAFNPIAPPRMPPDHLATSRRLSARHM